MKLKIEMETFINKTNKNLKIFSFNQPIQMKCNNNKIINNNYNN